MKTSILNKFAADAINSPAVITGGSCGKQPKRVKSVSKASKINKASKIKSGSVKSVSGTNDV